jgi:hypothetical protein
MKNIWRYSAIAGAALISSSAGSQDNVSFWAIGVADCASFVSAVEIERRSIPQGAPANSWTTQSYGNYLGWVSGYMTAANLYDPAHKMVGSSTTWPPMMLSIETNCRQHPLDRTNAAIEGLRNDLIQKEK